MKIQAPEGKQVVVAQGSTVDAHLSIDLDAGTYTVSYGPPGAGPLRKTAKGELPTDTQTALKHLVRTAVEAAEGWSSGASK